MQYDEFITKVAERAGTRQKQAEALTRATLQTLGERVTGGEAQDLAAQLPQPLKAAVPQRPTGTAEPFDLNEFERRVAERAGVAEGEDEAGIRAVFQTLREAVSPGEFDDVLAQLPADVRSLAAA
ncbi:MAG: hypothetical protein JWN65_317 [Solirubrobacterales bacterium]|jgi:uncharacterized protein (DUF2267 family)|nr:hypothetical protein [Solirubrobacterales bacterium]